MSRIHTVVWLAVIFVAAIHSSSVAATHWSFPSGAWSTQDGRLDQKDAQESQAIAQFSERVPQDRSFRAKIRLASGRGWVALAIRDYGSGHFAGLALTRRSAQTGEVTLCEVLSDTELEPDAPKIVAPLPDGERHELRCDIKGIWMVGYLDGKRIGAIRVWGDPKARPSLITRSCAATFDGVAVSAIKEFDCPESHIRFLDGEICKPRRSWDETIGLCAKFMSADLGEDTIAQALGENVPPYVYHGVIYLPSDLRYSSSYPAFHHSVFIDTFLDYYAYSGDRDSLRRAIQLGDWNLAHRTPASTRFPHLPYSTFTDGKPMGFVDGKAVMLDKPARMGSAFVHLYRVTGQRKYLNAARQIADVLASLQHPDGSWDFRVDPVTGQTIQPYTSNTIFAICLFDTLDALDATRPYAKASAAALRWTLDNPVRTFRWEGFYEDVPVGSVSYENFDAIEFARYLLQQPNRRPEYVKIAKSINDWTLKWFSESTSAYGPGINEQRVCFLPMTAHTAHWAILAFELSEATGDRKLRNTAISAINACTYPVEDNGFCRIPMFSPNWQGPYWYSVTSALQGYSLMCMGYAPEMAPDGASHLLKTSSTVQRIEYGADSIGYRTFDGGCELLKLVRKPVSVSADGRTLERNVGENGWTYNGKTNVLTVKHSGREVNVRLR